MFLAILAYDEPREFVLFEPSQEGKRELDEIPFSIYVSDMGRAYYSVKSPKVSRGLRVSVENQKVYLRLESLTFVVS